MAAAKIIPLVAGNWKMNGLAASEAELARIISGSKDFAGKAELMVCPPATLVAAFAGAARGSPVLIGAQDCHAEPSGAHTGDIAAEMLADAGARAVIVGHSERRADHHETDAQVRAKAQAAWRAGLTAIVCVGEQRTEREAGKTLQIVGRQLDGSLPDGATRVQFGRCVRTRLGDRNRPHADSGGCGRGPRVHSRPAEQAPCLAGGKRTDPLWRFGQA